jgi:hypothetical protein
VAVRDALGNTVTSATGTVTLSRQSGTGTLTGTLTATLSGGVATFTNVGYNTAESGLVIRATHSAMTADTGSLTVAAVPGKCQLQLGAFSTRDGGCYDANTGLAWSSLSASTMSWYDAVWDETLAANNGTKDAGDYGRTNDYPPGPGSCGGDCDNSAVNYCKSLNEGGQTDWRVPTSAELQAVRVNSATASGALAFLNGAANQNTWASDTSATTTSAVAVNLNSGASNVAKSTLLKTYCVRGGRTNVSYMVVSYVPSVVAVSAVSQPLSVQFKDTLGRDANVEGITLGMTTNFGNLGGSITGLTTNREGKANISGYTLDTVGTALLTITAAGYTNLTQSVSIVSGSHTCKVNDANFVTADGGCKHLATGLVWSKGAGPMPWHMAIWDSLLTGNAPPDAFDGSRTHDYDVTLCDAFGGRNAYCDQTGSGAGASESGNYCHSLVEGGKSDWRMPTYAELFAVSGSSKAAIYFDTGGGSFGADVNQYFLSSTSYPLDSRVIYKVILSNGGVASDFKTGANFVVCVRP